MAFQVLHTWAMQYREQSSGSRAGACRTWISRLYTKIQALPQVLCDGRGQDLIEYALVAALISLAATVGMRSVATALGTAFTNIGTHFSTYTS